MRTVRTRCVPRARRDALRIALQLIDDNGAARRDAEIAQSLEVVVERLGYILRSRPEVTFRM